MDNLRGQSLDIFVKDKQHWESQATTLRDFYFDENSSRGLILKVLRGHKHNNEKVNTTSSLDKGG